jgi:putative transposase
VGIDLGLTDFLVTSDGKKVKPLKVLIKYQKKLARLQKQLSKKLKGSNNAKEARLKVARHIIKYQIVAKIFYINCQPN